MTCGEDTDVWHRPKIKENGGKYYDYIIIYTGNFLVISTKLIKILNKLDQHYALNKYTSEETKLYLVSGISNYNIYGSKKPKYATRYDKHVKDFIRNKKCCLTSRNIDLKWRPPSVLSSGYK